jgi:hypothetical protein
MQWAEYAVHADLSQIAQSDMPFCSVMSAC